MFGLSERPVGLSVGQSRTSAIDKRFDIPEQCGMQIASLRAELGLSQEAFAKRVGLRSKSYVSELESANDPRCSVRVALEIERLSEGRIAAASLNPGVALVRAAD